MMMQRVMEGERLIGFLDEWPPLLSDLEGMRGTVLQVLWSRERERGVSVEAVGGDTTARTVLYAIIALVCGVLIGLLVAFVKTKRGKRLMRSLLLW